MARLKHEIDANADTVIILRNPDASFASWSPIEVATEATALVDRSIADDLTITDANKESSGEAAPVANDSSQTNLIGPYTTEDEIRYYVSRRHLTSASPTFERMLSEMTWKEGIRNDDDGLYHVDTEEWDSKALLYVLQILHHRNRQVPRTVSLEMLAKIAVLIDFYRCAEALESFTERWVGHLQVTSPVPSDFCRDLMLWMCIAWVLRLPQEFAQTTTVAIRRDDEQLPTLGLPITICVVRIEETRKQAIGTVFSQLQELLQEFRNPLYQCPRGESFECGSMLYGALTKEMELQGLLPVPMAPFSGLRVSELYTKMKGIRSPAWCRPGTTKRSQHHCNLGDKVMAIADPVIRLANGPELKDFDFR